MYNLYNMNNMYANASNNILFYMLVICGMKSTPLGNELGIQSFIHVWIST